MSYDPFLRKEAFADKPWYEEFLIFHNIGVCQVPDEHAAETREALARFLFATRTTPGKEPGTTLVVGTYAIETGDMEAYIQTIRGDSAVNRLSAEESPRTEAPE